MDEEKAREILQGYIGGGCLSNVNAPMGSDWICYGVGHDRVTLDGDFTIEELEAVVFWINKYKK